MSKHDYIPRRNGNRHSWANNMKTKIPTQGVTIGLTALEITEVTDGCDDITEAVNELAIAKSTFDNATNAANVKLNKGIFLIRKNVKRGKTSSAYTTAIGEDLGIIGDEISIDPATSQPELKNSKDPAGPRIDFNLRGFFDGVNIYRQKQDETAYHFIAYDTSNPYIDTDPTVKAGTKYYAFYVIAETEVGLKSNIVEI